MLKSSRTKRRTVTGKTIREITELHEVRCSVAWQSQCWPQCEDWCCVHCPAVQPLSLSFTELHELHWWQGLCLSLLGPLPLAKWLLSIHLSKSRCQESRQLTLLGLKHKDCERHLQLLKAAMMTTAEPQEAQLWVSLSFWGSLLALLLQIP